MARETRRAPLVLSDAHRQMLIELSGSRTAPAREVERAKVLLRYAGGISISDIQRQLGVSRPTIYKCIDKALSAGVQVGLKDTFHEGAQEAKRQRSEVRRPPRSRRAACFVGVRAIARVETKYKATEPA